MSFLQRMFGGDAPGLAGRDPSDDRWWGPIGKNSVAGVRVTLESAMKAPPVYACVNTIRETAAALPFGVFAREENARRKLEDHPLARLMSAPNPEWTAFEFVGQMIWDLASCGNFFAEKRFDARGEPVELWRLDPEQVVVERTEEGERRYRVRDDRGRERILLSEEVLFIRDTPIVNNLVGASRIDFARDAIGALLAAQEMSGAFFRNDMTPPFMILLRSRFDSEASRSNYMSALRKWFGGNNRGNPGAFDNAEKVEKLGHTPEQSQFIETRKFQAHEIARIWRMPPHKIGLMDNATFTNIEHQSIEFVVDTVGPWLKLIERALWRWLLGADPKLFFEFNVRGLLRGDIEKRYASYARGRQWGWLSINEIRSLENMNPIKNGDDHLQPMNMQPAGTASPQAVLGLNGEAVSTFEGGVWRRTAPSKGATEAIEIAA